METYTLQREMDKNLQFTGKNVASVASTADKSKGRWFSGYLNEWTELSLYETAAGDFVCERITHIVFDGERDIHECIVCNSVDAVIGFFGTDWLAKELYTRVGIKAVEVIE